MSTKSLIIVGFSLLLVAATVADPAGQKEHTLKVGKKGEITLAQKASVGARVLEPGTYVVQHRVSGGAHFVRFLELKQVQTNPGSYEGPPDTYTEGDNAGEIKCRVEPTTETIKETTVYTVNEGGKLRITEVAIKGENVIHVF